MIYVDDDYVFTWDVPTITEWPIYTVYSEITDEIS